jgi:hypothetical protein
MDLKDRHKQLGSNTGSILQSRNCGSPINVEPLIKMHNKGKTGQRHNIPLTHKTMEIQLNADFVREIQKPTLHLFIDTVPFFRRNYQQAYHVRNAKENTGWMQTTSAKTLSCQPESKT